MQNFYRLFVNWAKKNRLFVYNDIKNVRQFKLRFVLGKWRNYLGRSEAERNKDNAAVKFRNHCLMTKVLVSIYSNKLAETRIKSFLRKKIFLKFFKRIWMPKAKKSIFLRSVFLKADKRLQFTERSRY